MPPQLVKVTQSSSGHVVTPPRSGHTTVSQAMRCASVRNTCICLLSPRHCTVQYYLLWCECCFASPADRFNMDGITLFFCRERRRRRRARAPLSGPAADGLALQGALADGPVSRRRDDLPSSVRVSASIS
jgi:hypothetical protein